MAEFIQGYLRFNVRRDASWLLGVDGLLGGREEGVHAAAVQEKIRFSAKLFRD